MVQLLAKSAPQVSLPAHINDCLFIAEHLIALKRLYGEEFICALRIAIYLHDTGKSHKHFQKLLRKDFNEWAGRRHEIYSTLIALNLPQDTPYREEIILAVLGHHKQFRELHDHLSQIEEDNAARIERGQDAVFKDYSDFPELALSSIKNILTEIGLDNSIQAKEPFEIRKILNRQLRLKSHMDGNCLLKLLMAGALKQCDHLGSAQIRTILTLKASNFSKLNTQLGNLRLHHHQAVASRTTGNVLLTSPTGTGKTETSLLWLNNQISEQGAGTVYYILPYTASINAMHKRMEKLFGDKVGLVHGKLDAYLYDYFQEQQYSENQLTEKIKELREQFKSIATPIKICTPFQLLKYLYGIKGFDKGFAEMAGSYFIFDEIHAYEPSLFAQIISLLRFSIEQLQVNCFIMTATLPLFMKSYLKEALQNCTEIVAEESLYNKLKRHSVKLLDHPIPDIYPMIWKDLNEDKKVLVVCNTIQRSQEVFSHFKNYPNKILLHGSFNGRDRIAKENQLSTLEQSTNKEGILLVGTQAIEVSLDIDYDIIYTEPAPLDALLQRFGRVNRKNTAEHPAPCFVLRHGSKADKHIYEPSVLKRTLEILEKIEDTNNGVIVEQHLQSYIDIVYPCWEEKQEKEYSETLDRMEAQIKQLAPFVHIKENEQDFYAQFDGIKAVPLSEAKNYKNLIAQRKFIEGDRLTVSIRKRNYCRLKQQELLVNDYIVLEGDKNIIFSFHLLRLKYNEEVGLIQEPDTSLDNENIFWD